MICLRSSFGFGGFLIAFSNFFASKEFNESFGSELKLEVLADFNFMIGAVVITVTMSYYINRLTISGLIFMCLIYSWLTNGEISNFAQR